MDAADGEGHITQGDNELAVFVDADDIALGSFEHTAGDADEVVVLGVLADGDVEKAQTPGGQFVDHDEVFHLLLGNLCRLLGSLVAGDIPARGDHLERLVELTERSFDEQVASTLLAAVGDTDIVDTHLCMVGGYLTRLIFGFGIGIVVNTAEMVGGGIGIGGETEGVLLEPVVLSDNKRCRAGDRKSEVAKYGADTIMDLST